MGDNSPTGQNVRAIRDRIDGIAQSIEVVVERVEPLMNQVFKSAMAVERAAREWSNLAESIRQREERRDG